MAEKTVYIIDPISQFEGYTYKRWIEDTKDLKPKDTLRLVLNCYGGDVFDGLAIYNAIQSHPGKKSVLVAGIAASIASIIALAGDELVMSEGSMLMIHRASTFSYGNANDLEKNRNTLLKIDDVMSSLYARKTGLEESEILAMMDAETWFTAEEAVDKGFADRIDGSAEMVAFAGENPFSKAPERIAALFTGINPPSIQAAGIPNKESGTMPDTPATPVEHPVTPAPIVATAPIAPKASLSDDEILEIRELCTLAGNPQAAMDFVLSKNKPAEVRAALAKALTPTPSVGGPPSHVTAGADELDKFHTAASNAILAFGNGKATDKKALEKNPYRGASIVEMAQDYLRIKGQKIPYGAEAVLMNAMGNGSASNRFSASGYNHSTSDFNFLLADTINRELSAAFLEAPRVYEQYTRRGSFSDFRPRTIMRFSNSPDPKKVLQNGELEEVTFTDEAESYRIYDFGSMASITREALINDDKGAFTRIPQLLGNSYTRKIAKTVAELFNNGHTAAYNMADGNPLFDATNHLNYGTTGTALSGPNLDAARVAFFKQKGLDKNILGIMPRILLVPPALESTARTILESTGSIDSEKNSGVINAYRGLAQLVVDPFLANGILTGGSDTAWGLLASPSDADTIEVGYLNGQDTPTVDVLNNEGNILGIRIRSFMPFGVKATDWRFVFKRTGQA
jgi:ATP-dependent protease ClpP protease subunit